MKTKLFTLLLAVAASIGTMFASTKIGNLSYNLDATNQTAEVASNSDASGEIIIPSSVTYNSVSYSVTSIGNYAFIGCSGLTSVTIPNSVTSIGDYAFIGCSGLTSVTIPNSVTSIGEGAFYDCTGLTSVTIPNSVTSIESWAFSGCTALTAIIVDPENLNYSDIDGVLLNRNQTELLRYPVGKSTPNYTIPNSVTSIGSCAFEGCSVLTSMTIPNSVTSIGSSAFFGCSGLTSIEIPNSITGIGEDAFRECTGLTSIEIPNSITSIGNSAFYGCTGLTSIEIPNSVTSIESWAFRRCSGLTSVAIGNSVTSIVQDAFSFCPSLKSVTINSNAIANKTYTTNSNIKSIFGVQVEEYVLGQDVKSIGSYAFYQCDSLSTVTIGDSIKSIGIHAFAECAKLNSITWNAKSCDDFTNYSPFYPLNIESFTFGNEVEKIPAYLCSRLYNVGNIVIPNSVTSIGDCAFEYCNLTSITIPNSVIHIGDNVLSNCSGITHPVYNASHFVRLPLDYSGEFSIQSGITTICGGAFVACYDLTSVSIPNSVTKIGNNAFAFCDGLTSVTIPNSVTSIESNAFRNCSSLTSIIIPNSVQNCTWRVSLHNENLENVNAPTWFFDVVESNWANCPKHLQSVTVNDGVINDNVLGVISRSYKTLKQLDIAAVTNTSLADEAFKSYYNLTSLALPEGLEYIDYMTVADCKSLQSIAIPASVTEIGNSAFEDCRSLSEVVFAENPQLERIGNWAFYNCHTLQNLTIPEGVTEIGDGAFYGCTYLEELNLPASVQSMGNNAFALCSKIKMMNVDALLPPDVEAKTFYEVSRTAPVYVPDESLEAYFHHPIWSELNIVGKSQAPSSISNIQSDNVQTTKILHNGQILILRGDKVYTLQGQEVR